MKHLKNRQQGFTIIEVMIVLVIAAVILLIVFLAVPALQRNSRNTQRKNDVAGVLGAINEYMANNNGAYPAVVCNDPTDTTVTVGGGNCGTPSNPVTAKVSGNFTIDPPAIAGYSNGQSPTADQLKVYTGSSCNGAALANGPGRSVAILYQVETNINQCSSS